MKRDYLIVQKSLSMFNIDISNEDWNETSTEYQRREVKLCKIWLGSAFLRVVREFKWSFLTEKINIDRLIPGDIGGKAYVQSGQSSTTPCSFFGFKNTFEIKDDIFEITEVYNLNDRKEKVNYKVHGSYIYTNESNIEVVGVKKKQIDEYECPIEFWDMVCYALALLIAPSIAPRDAQIQQLIMTQYQWCEDKLLKLETQKNIKRQYHEELDE